MELFAPCGRWVKRRSILTFLLHFAALELLNAVKFVTSSPIESNHVVSIIAVRPASPVERTPHVVVVTVAPVVRVSRRLTAFRFLEIVQPLVTWLVDSLHVAATWTRSPVVLSARNNRKIRLQTEEDSILWSVCDEWTFQRGLLYTVHWFQGIQHGFSEEFGSIRWTE